MKTQFMVLAIACGLTFTGMVFGQEQGDPNRKGMREAGGMMPQMTPSSPPVIAVGENSLFVLINGVMKRLDKKTLKVLAEKSLEDAGEDQDAFTALDKNKDGGLTPEEVPLPPEIFARADQNADGVIAKTEVPPMLLERFSGKAMKKLLGGPATITVDKGDAALYVYYGGTLYRLNGSTLNVEAKIQLVDETSLFQLPKGERKGEKRRDEKAPGDFQPPGGEPVF